MMCEANDEEERSCFDGLKLGGNPDGTCAEDRWTGAFIVSQNQGQSWLNTSSERHDLPPGYLASVKNPCILTSDVILVEWKLKAEGWELKMRW